MVNQVSSEAVDPTWKGVYKAGGLAALAIAILYFIGAALWIIIGPLSSNAQTVLESLPVNAGLLQSTLSVFVLTDFLSIPMTLSLYLVLKGINKNAILVATGFSALFVVLDLGVTLMNHFALFTLSQNYVAAAGDAQRSALIAAANYALATLPTATGLYSFLVPSVGSIITALVMLKGVFSKATAYVGIFASIITLVCSVVYLIAPTLSVLLMVALIAWGIWGLPVGFRLYKLSK